MNVTIITGGGRGIGAATALLAAERGHAIVLNYLGNHDAADAVVRQITERGGQAIAVAGDISRTDDVEQLFAACDRAFGPPTALINNAGIVAPMARVEDIDEPRLTRMFAVNVIASFLCARAAVRRMARRHGGRGGSIVNVSSAAARLGSPGEYVDYAATKAAIDTFTIGLAREVAADGIRVNAVRPGIIDTEIHATSGDAGRAHRLAPALPIQRAGTADEVARAILWLASADASYCTGSILDVAGGR